MKRMRIASAAIGAAAVSTCDAQNIDVDTSVARTSHFAGLTDSIAFNADRVDTFDGPTTVEETYFILDHYHPNRVVYVPTMRSTGDGAGLNWSGSGTTTCAMPDGALATPVDPDNGTFVSAISAHTIAFTTTHPIDITLSYEATATAVGVPDAVQTDGLRVFLRDADGTYLEDTMEVTPGISTISEPGITVSLRPGRYSLYLYAQAFVGEFQGYESQHVSYSWNAQVVPAPGVLAVAGLTGLAASRRRR